ncbi:MAG TPA: A24 family peptidase [Methylocella sp.]|nr:A24 family peptidase [Methylocella sp.]
MAEEDVAGMKSRKQGWPSPLEYAALALAASLIAAASLAAAPGLPGVFGGALGIVMLAIAAADARFFIIPDELTACAAALALANAAVSGADSVLDNVASAGVRGLLLALAFYTLRRLYWRLRHREGIGLGDVKLAAAAGAWLDWTFILLAIEIAALAGIAGYTAMQIAARRPLSAVAKLPFGLFFAPAIWICWLLHAILPDI